MVKVNCEDCLYWEPPVEQAAGPSERSGHCRRSAPRWGAVSASSDVSWGWPRTDPMEWCGEGESELTLAAPKDGGDLVLIEREEHHDAEEDGGLVLKHRRELWGKPGRER